MKSWRTTLMGILAAVVAIGNFVITYLQTGQIGDFTPVVVAVVAAVGLINARDNVVSSEQAGATGDGKSGKWGMNVLLLMFLIPTVAFASGCPTKKSQLEKAAKASFQVSGLTIDVLKATRKAYEENLIDLDTKNKMADSLKLLALGGEAFNNAVKGAVNEYGASGKIPLSKYQELNVLFSNQVVAPFLQISTESGLLSNTKATYLRVAIMALKATIVTIGKGFSNSVAEKIDRLTPNIAIMEKDYGRLTG